MSSNQNDKKDKPKRGRGRPTERRYPERIDASPEKNCGDGAANAA